MDKFNSEPQRWVAYCRAVAPDGRVCSLYAPHQGGHLPKHGIESDRWEDDA